ncbi:NAD-dependent epimerase/dehydratase family protein [Flavobacterium sp. GA093]|uniref:NAD-dependent epimerase/dehydratase family protein n=1 Tax=Flavobacterium hydrocarbonoxydans TaxID=2683249 RepID=A0A6I4NTX8_9FLAO|nr:NAD-dependent epimerase/dehydratase family protein [Flavobacterium hydrocarbonoxydans]MWB94484.1 NAD-dependent epimerase/dehydratase family protein [Flavobacterium hydrocarbonoxydans]
MKLLVTGAAGFIGYHLVKALLKENIEVVGIDNINDYYDVNLKFSRLEQSGIDRNLLSNNNELIVSKFHPNYQFAKTDITDLVSLENLFKDQKFTHVVNLAAQAGVRYSLINPHAYVQTNIAGFVNILECCRYNNIKHFVYASSSSVYGENKKIPFSEDDRVDNPISLYAATKKSNELMAFTYSHLYQLPTTGLRFFTVYGPWGRPDMAPFLFADAILKEKPIKVFNNGEMLRDFTYIDDIVEGIVKCLNVVPEQDQKASVYNIGNSKPINLMEFISVLENSLEKKAVKEFLPMQDGDVKVTYADTTKLSNATNYKPSVELVDGVKEFSLWFKKYHND